MIHCCFRIPDQMLPVLPTLPSVHLGGSKGGYVSDNGGAHGAPRNCPWASTFACPLLAITVGGELLDEKDGQSPFQETLDTQLIQG